MNYGTRTGSAGKLRTPCIIVGIHEKKQLTGTAKELDQVSGGYLRKVLRRGDIKGKTNRILILHDVPNVNAIRVMLVGLGDRDTMDAARFIGAARAVAGRLKSLGAKSALCCLLDVKVPGKDMAWKTIRFIEQLESVAYRFTKMKGKQPEDDGKLESVEFFLKDKGAADPVKVAIRHARALALGVAAAKDLGNTPGNICTPGYIADMARDLADDYALMDTGIVDEQEMEDLGMGAFMSVTRGSDQPGKLITITYRGGKPKEEPHVLVGKGITFDTGGISLKPGAGMHEMIFDMCGAASVFGVMKAVAEQELPLNVTGVIAAAENMPSGKASRPGDIVKTLSGQTVEILNTDAEGRLVLCDALTYIERYNPKTVVDIATLTGACVIALGRHASALYANDDRLAEELDQAGREARDRVWRMPLWKDYDSQLQSAFADIANIGGREAGSVTAACFLARFAKKYRWAHLDIAGTAYLGNGPAKGATGRPVPLLVEYLNRQSAKGE